VSGLRAPVANTVDEGDALAGRGCAMDSYQKFFSWCDRQGLKADREIAEAFGMTPQTVRNWKHRLEAGEGVPPTYLGLACVGFESARSTGNGEVPRLEPMTVDFFKTWREHRGLETLESTGGAFGLTRQAIHNWFKRDRLPRWLPLACLGYEVRTSPEGSGAAASNP